MTRPANNLRGEAELRIEGKTVLLRPSFANLVAAEEELGSLFSLVERASDGKITLSEIAALLWHCLDAEPRPARDTVGETVLALGLVAATKPVRVLLAQVVQGRM